MSELHDACRNGDIKYITNNDISQYLNKKDDYGYTPFWWACQNSYKKIVEILLKTDGFTSLNEKDNSGATPFHWACHDGRKEIVEILLKADGFASLNEKDNNGLTPFHHACFKNRKEIMELLLKADGFNCLNEKDKKDWTAFYYACLNGKREIVKLLLKQKDIIIPDKLVYPSNDNNNIKQLVESYNKNPSLIRTLLILDENIDTYRHIVFLSDNYYRIKQDENNSTRFFKITSRLPLELQMILIHRLCGSTQQVITSKTFVDDIVSYVKKYFYYYDY